MKLNTRNIQRNIIKTIFIKVINEIDVYVWSKYFVYLNICSTDDLKILATVNKLIENGAAINSQNGIDSPLHIAVSKRLQKTTELLVKKGANVNHVGRGNATPILSYTCPEKCKSNKYNEYCNFTKLK